LIAQRIQVKACIAKALANVCVYHLELCDRFGVNSYPTIFIIDEASSKVYRYEGPRTEEKLLAFYTDGEWRDTPGSDFPTPQTKLEGPSPIISSLRMSFPALNYVIAHPILSSIYFIVIAIVVVFGYLSFCEPTRAKDVTFSEDAKGV